MLEKSIRRAVKVRDLISPIDDYRRRAIALEQCPLQHEGRRRAAGAGEWSFQQPRRIARRAHGESREIGNLGKPMLSGARPAVDTPLLAEQLEQVLRAAPGLRITQEHVAAIAQREMQQ